MDPIFVKYCKKEHNIALGAPTIQLGTFQYYREEFEVNSATGDPTEATSGISVDTNQPRTLNEEEIDVFSGGLIKGDKVLVSGGGRHYIGSTFRNCYIFCSTICDELASPSPEEAAKFKADSWYQILNLKHFVTIVGSSLVANMTLDRFDDDHVEKLKKVSFDHIQFAFEFRAVDYIESRTNKIKDGEKIPSKVERERSIWDAVFQKENHYKPQREHRILFYWIHPEIGCYL